MTADRTSQSTDVRHLVQEGAASSTCFQAQGRGKIPPAIPGTILPVILLPQLQLYPAADNRGFFRELAPTIMYVQSSEDA